MNIFISLCGITCQDSQDKGFGSVLLPPNGISGIFFIFLRDNYPFTSWNIHIKLIIILTNTFELQIVLKKCILILTLLHAHEYVMGVVVWVE